MREQKSSAKEFYQDNATNVCKVPKTPNEKGGWKGVRRAEKAQFVAPDVLVMTLWEAFDFAEKYAKACMEKK